MICLCRVVNDNRKFHNRASFFQLRIEKIPQQDEERASCSRLSCDARVIRDDSRADCVHVAVVQVGGFETNKKLSS